MTVIFTSAGPRAWMLSASETSIPGPRRTVARLSPDRQVRFVARGIGESPPPRRVGVADDPAAGRERGVNAGLHLVARHVDVDIEAVAPTAGSWPEAAASSPIAATRASPAEKEPVRKRAAAYPPPRSTRQSVIPGKAENCAAVSRPLMSSLADRSSVTAATVGPVADDEMLHRWMRARPGRWNSRSKRCCPQWRRAPSPVVVRAHPVPRRRARRRAVGRPHASISCPGKTPRIG
jgi:hypothetical protein